MLKKAKDLQRGDVIVYYQPSGFESWTEPRENPIANLAIVYQANKNGSITCCSLAVGCGFVACTDKQPSASVFGCNCDLEYIGHVPDDFIPKEELKLPPEIKKEVEQGFSGEQARAVENVLRAVINHFEGKKS